jgi:UDP-N-acetyl-D-galactosamine dehydrogenase
MSFDDLYNGIVNRKEKISLIGLGYVGLPIAVSFSKRADVIGFDISKEKINLYKNGIDPTKEVGNEAIAACMVDFLLLMKQNLREAKFHIVAVPTPVNVLIIHLIYLQLYRS